MVTPEQLGVPVNIPPPPPGAFPSSMPSNGSNRTIEEVDAALGMTGMDPVPVLSPPEETSITLPGGWITPRGLLHTNAVVRELNGYDEESLSKGNALKNVARYTTDLIERGVEHIGGEKPDKQALRELLTGDRDALVIGIRKATYGKNVDLILKCDNCDEKSDVTIDLDADVEVKTMEDPHQRAFDVTLKHGRAKVTLINGVVQEKLGDMLGKRTAAEFNTVILSQCVLELDGMATLGSSDPIRSLSSADRGTLIDFIMENQPGPKLDGITVPCAFCEQEYPVSLGIGNLFRF